MDTLYIGDIPSNYKYALFGNGYIDLYNTNILHNNNYDFYRIYTNAGGFFYDHRSTSVGQYTTTYTTEVSVTDKPSYRFDFVNVVVISCVLVIFGVWLLNIMTSLIRKGGLLGGLL